MEKFFKSNVQDIRFRYKIMFYAMFGIFWSFSNVGYSFGFLTWFAFVPFLFSIKYENFRYGVFYSWIFGVSAYLFHFWWMANPFISYFSNEFLPPSLGFISYFIGGIVTLAVCAYHGVMYVLVYIIAKYIVTKKKGSVFYLVMPVVVTVVDYFFPKLWYDQIGYSQYIFLNFSQIADLFGAPLITFIVIGFNSFVIILIECILYKNHLRYGIVLVAFGICVVVIASLYGDFRQKQILNISKDMTKVKIGIVQGNFSGLDKKNNNKINNMLGTYNEMSKVLLDKSPDLIVWPESSIPKYFDVNVKNFSNVKLFDKAPLLFGTHIFQIDKDKQKIYNSIVLVSENGLKLDQYDKQKLLMFAEGMPFEFLDEIMNIYGLGTFTKGKEYKVMEIDKIKMATNICYEDIIPEFIRKSLNVNGKEANLIINATNDSWFGETIEPKMHLQIAGFRSIENRKTLIRSTCTGFSGVFDPTGNLIYISKLYKPDSTVVEVPLMEIKTIYRMGGYLFVYFLGLIILVVFCLAIFRKINFYFKKSRIINAKHHKKMLYQIWTE